MESQSTAELLAEQIRDAILVGSLKPGDRLIEQELSESFGTSRGPIREAIRILATEGLIELRKNRGAVVSAPTFDDVLEVYAIRMSLGALAIEHACHLSAQENLDLTEVTKKLEKIRKALGGNSIKAVAADLEFQSALIALGALPRVTESFSQTAVDVGVFVQFLGIRYDATDHAALVKRHEKLLVAISKGDVDQAVYLWKNHIRTSVREFMKPFSETEIEQLFARPLMRNVFEVESAK
jgi:DNA-binding GntR family transcriptional regulator